MTMPFSRFAAYFLEVARTGSLRKAADHLYISVSAIHRQISLAEEELGVPLFERFPNGLKLTLAGEMLYADLLKWNREFQQTRIKFDEIQGLKRGTIEFGLITALSEGFVIDAIQQIHEKYPWINFRIDMDSSEAVAQKIMATELDFGLLLDPVENSHLDVRTFVEIPLGFAMSPAHALAQNVRLNLSDTVDSRHMLADAPLMIHDRVMTIYKKHQFMPAQTTTSNHIQMMISMLKQNMGIAILSYLDVLPHLEKKELIFIPLQEKGIRPLTVALCVDPRRQLSRASTVLMDQMIQRMEDLKHDLVAMYG
ncbi:LysR family transcriptional regulator [Acinetobacter sp. WZC-1]|uniref:LysR family transcriptional regulator n=1 Tax=Acinetobacter sp. WZC-1 TaxID=3459034 RepID=UPI00403D939C